jgi:hypothetical protein
MEAIAGIGDLIRAKIFLQGKRQSPIALQVCRRTRDVYASARLPLVRMRLADRLF